MELKELIASGPVAMDIEAAEALADFLTEAGAKTGSNGLRRENDYANIWHSSV